MIKHLQHGFIGPAVLYFTTFLLCVVLAALPSCGSATTNCADPKNAASVQCLPHDVSACVQAEAAIIASGKSVSATIVGIGAQIAIAYATGGASAVLATIEQLVLADGEQIVSCVVADMSTQPSVPVSVPASGSGAPASAAAPPSLQDVLKGVVTAKKWPLAPAKK